MQRTMLTRMAVAGLLTAVMLATGTRNANAGLTPEQKCQKARKEAAAKYAQCHEKAIGQLLATNSLVKLQPALSKCRVKFTGTWLKLQKKALGTGATCDASRFVDTGLGTVVDNLTGLEWEQKGDLPNVHDQDVRLGWFTAHQCFLVGASSCPGLNEPNGSFACFADDATNVCNWRLPTVAELQTILLEPFPCTTSPCIPAVFGTTAAADYWSDTTLADNSAYAWSVDFVTGEVSYAVKGAVGNAVRGVRGGL